MSANSFSEEKNISRIDDNTEQKNVCLGKDKDDQICNDDYEKKFSLVLNCAQISENYKCSTLNPATKAYKNCCKLPAENNFINCRMSGDKYSVFCKEGIDGQQSLYQLVNEDGLAPMFINVDLLNKGVNFEEEMPYDYSRFYFHPNTTAVRCKITLDKEQLFCKDSKSDSDKEYTYTIVGKEGFIPVSNKNFGPRKEDKIIPNGETRPVLLDQKSNIKK